MTTGNTRSDRTVSDEIHSAVGELGFAEAFRQHIAAIALAHIGTEIGTRLKDLHEWMSADPALAGILPALEVAGPNQPAGGANVVAEADLEPTAPTPSPPDGRLPDIRESNGSAMWLRWQEPFANWGGTVRNTPALTAVPRTVGGVQALTRWAIQSGRTVRGAGYRHSWTDLFSADNQVLVSMLPPPTVVDLPAVDPPDRPRRPTPGHLHRRHRRRRRRHQGAVQDRGGHDERPVPDVVPVRGRRRLGMDHTGQHDHRGDHLRRQ